MAEKNKLKEALSILEKENGISKEEMLESIETALITACKKNYDIEQNNKVIFNEKKGTLQLFAQKEVVEAVENDNLQITLENARKIDNIYNIGDICNIEVIPKDFNRITAQTAKQVIVQKIRDSNKNKIYNKYKSYEKEIVTALIQRIDFERKNVILAIDGLQAILPSNEQIPGENYTVNEKIKVYILELSKNSKGIQALASRGNIEFVVRLFEETITEIYDGVVKIEAVSREPGQRSKVALSSTNENVDPIGSCIGENGLKINSIINELNGEKIDLIKHDKEPEKFIVSALSPSKPIGIEVDEVEKSAKVVVKDEFLSLAIGKRGQNVRLAVKLTGYKIDIKSQTQAIEENYIDNESYLENE